MRRLLQFSSYTRSGRNSRLDPGIAEAVEDLAVVVVHEAQDPGPLLRVALTLVALDQLAVGVVGVEREPTTKARILSQLSSVKEGNPSWATWRRISASTSGSARSIA